MGLPFYLGFMEGYNAVSGLYETLHGRSFEVEGLENIVEGGFLLATTHTHASNSYEIGKALLEARRVHCLTGSPLYGAKLDFVIGHRSWGGKESKMGKWLIEVLKSSVNGVESFLLNVPFVRDGNEQTGMEWFLDKVGQIKSPMEFGEDPKYRGQTIGTLRYMARVLLPAAQSWLDEGDVVQCFVSGPHEDRINHQKIVDLFNSGKMFSGASRIALQTGYPIIPGCIFKSPDEKLTRITLSKPIPVEISKKSLRGEVRELNFAIASELDRLYAIESDRYKDLRWLRENALRL